MPDIPFNIPLVTGREEDYLGKVLEGNKFCGDGPYTLQCQQWLEQHHNTPKALLTTSCTHAMELAALLIGVQPGDEVIMPSFTFVSTANAFVLRGARIVFVDVRPDTMNLDAGQVEEAITEKTKAIVPVHYAGVGCDMETIMDLAAEHDLFVLEDAAQCILAGYRNKPLGSLGHFGALSFHETKNIHCGEGGALLINDESFIEKAEILREKGTNRKKFLRGEVDKYSWVETGSSYLPSELNAAFLWAQLEQGEKIISRRLKIWERYYELLLPLKEKGEIELPHIPEEASHNGHLFYIKVQDEHQRQALIDHLKNKGIQAVFHYVPLHSAKAGIAHGIMENDRYTTKESNRLVRLPMYYKLSLSHIEEVVKQINAFFS